ncbi:MAG: M13 family metallopeptidase [Elusimicrobia bacterium]|nr:M13 family metallopeptidase [Elusimicrobiota bacterium]
MMITAPLLLAALLSPARAEEPSLPYTPALDPAAMDRTVDPCVDLYQYSCGGWRKRNPIPPDRTSISVYAKLDEENLAFLRGVLDQAAAAKKRGKVDTEIGDFYAACLDENGIEKRGLAPLQPDLDAIAAAKSAADLAPVVARLLIETGDPQMMFSASSAQDADDSESEIPEVDQGGLGLPDRDYYVKEDPKSVDIRAKYVAHVAQVFALLGETPQAARADADTVMRMETDLAKASQTVVERRDPYKLKNKMTLAQLSALAPNFDWTAFVAALGAPKFKILNVASPGFFKELDALLKSEPMTDWKAYLRFHLANAEAPNLTAAFVNENFDFYKRELRGAKTLAPRWKRCVQAVDMNLGEALGQAYVRKVFSPALKARTQDMVARIESVMADRIQGLDWMSAPTKLKALAKLRAVRNKIGYPDHWRDYSLVKIVRDDWDADVNAATAFESRRQLAKIGKPVDHQEWQMTPPTVDAYYDQQMNDINFPAGVLQPPLYDAKLDAAPNYGDTGGTVGHELTHAFDDEGSKYDAHGNLKDWWTKEDRAQFDARTKCVQDQFSSYIAVDSIPVNGELTLGENVADLGGEVLAYRAWKASIRGVYLKKIDGLTPDQRFFVGFAQWACTNATPEQRRDWALTDPHAPARYRINGVVVNMPEFAHAFSCPAGAPMTKPAGKECAVW